MDCCSVAWWGGRSVKAGSGEGVMMVDGKVVSGVVSGVVVSGVVVVSGREMGSEGSVLCGEEKSMRKGSRVEVVEG